MSHISAQSPLSDLVINNADFLRQLSTSSRQRRSGAGTRRDMISRATTEQLLSLVECCFNILKARVPLNTAQKRRIARHAQHVRALARARSARSARNILMGRGALDGGDQKGRGVLPVAAAISQIILPLLHDYIYKSRN